MTVPASGARGRSGLAPTIALGVLAAAEVAAAASAYGPGLTPDSVQYLRAAAQWARNATLPADYVSWPPLFPMLLGSLQRAGVPALDAALALNSVLYALTAVTAARWAFRHTAATGAACAAAAAVAVAPPLLYVTQMLWSEALFVFLSLVALMRMESARTAPDWLAAGAWTALAVLTRYAGMPLIAAGAIVCVGRRCGWRALVLFVTVAAGPLLGWSIRNQALAGSWLGPRELREAALPSVLGQLWTTWQHWPWLAGASVLAIAVLGWSAVSRKRLGPGSENRAWSIAVAYVIAYLIFIVASASRVQIDRTETRLLIPIYVPIATWSVILLWQGLRELQLRFPRVDARYAALVFAISLVPPATEAGEIIRFAHRSGFGAFNNAAWAGSPLLRALRGRALAQPVYSNAPEVLWLRFGVEARMSPVRAQNDASLPEGATLVWFHRIGFRDYLVPLAELEEKSGVRRAMEEADGAVGIVRHR